MAGVVYAAVHLPEFPAQTLVRLRAELRGRAVAVMEGERPFERVCSTDAGARRMGAQDGMTRAEVEMCGVTLLRRSAKEEDAAREVVLESLASLSPWLEVVAGSGTWFTCVLDLSGTERLLGTPEGVARRAISRLEATGFLGRVAVAANLDAAVCLARSSRERVVVVPAGGEMRCLASLPLSSLEMEEEMGETLARWGLRTMGDLAMMPEVDLISRLGQGARRLWQRSRGECPHLFRPTEESFRLEEYVEFDGPVEALESLLFAVNPMLEQLMARAASRAMAIATVTLVCALDGRAEHVREVRPALPTSNRPALLKLLQLDLEAHAPGAGVLAVRLTAEPGPGSKVQMGLFSPQLPEPMRLEVTLARVAAIVGEGRVGRPVLEDTHRSDGVRLERFAAVEKGTEPGLWGAAPALRRVRPPLVMPVELERGRLRSLWHERVRYDVSRLYGPWQSSGAWWSGEVWTGETWDFAAMSAADGGVLLGVALHDLLRGVWLLDGLYD